MDASFVLRPMFGTKAMYLDGRLHLCFCANEEPWRGVLVATERPHHASLQAEFPSLVSHPILGKWLYLSEEHDDFEATARRLVALTRRRDPRIGITSPSRKRRKPSPVSRRKKRDFAP